MSYILSDCQGSLSAVELPPDLYKCGGTDGCGETGNAINAPFTTDYPQGLSPLFLDLALPVAGSVVRPFGDVGKPVKPLDLVRHGKAPRLPLVVVPHTEM